MSRRSVLFVQGVVLSAAFLLTAPRAQAGDRVHARSQPATRSQPVSVSVHRPASWPVTISLTTTAQAAAEPAYISLRGPDGRLRRFPVEGGADEMPSRIVILHPGESLTLQWTARK